jgi:hypothetical protein
LLKVSVTALGLRVSVTAIGGKGLSVTAVDVEVSVAA